MVSKIAYDLMQSTWRNHRLYVSADTGVRLNWLNTVESFRCSKRVQLGEVWKEALDSAIREL